MSQTRTVHIELSEAQAAYLSRTLKDQKFFEPGKASKDCCSQVAAKIDKALKPRVLM